MAHLLVRDLDALTMTRLKERARHHHRSLQGEAKAILEEVAGQASREEALAIVEKWRRHWGDRVFSDSAELIRQDRER